MPLLDMILPTFFSKISLSVQTYSLVVTELGRIQITQPICRKFFSPAAIIFQIWHDPKVIRHLSVIWEACAAVKFNIFSNRKLCFTMGMMSFLANVLFHESKNNIYTFFSSNEILNSKLPIRSLPKQTHNWQVTDR